MQQRSDHTTLDYLLLFQQGDMKGFGFLFREYYNALVYYSNKFIKDKPVAEGIASDALVILWERREDFKSLPAIRSFLYTTTRNLSLNWIRDTNRLQKRERQYASSQDATEPAIFQHLIETETYREIILVIDTLPEKCRQVIQLSFLQEKTPKEIAKEMNISPVTVCTQKKRAIRLIKERFGIYFILSAFLYLLQ